MVKGDRVFCQGLVIQIKQDLAFLDCRNIGKINAGKRVIAFGPLFLPSGACDDFAVKDDIDPMGILAGGKAEAVQQIGFGIGYLHINGLLGAGDNNGLGRILDQVRQGRRRISHGIRSMADDKTIIIPVVGFYGRGH